jgi:hypothetical protein
MPLASGLGASLGLAKETTYGTVVTPNRFFEFDSESLALDPTYFDPVGLRSNRLFAPSSRMRKTTRQAGGGTTLDAPTKQFGAVFDLMHGLAVTPVQQAATPAYLQTHAVGTSQPNKSATIQIDKPTAQAVDTPFTYPGSILTTAAFSMDNGGSLKAALTWDCQDELTPYSTPTGPSLTTPAYAAGSTVWDSTQVAAVTLNGTPVASVQSLTVTWTQPFKEDRFFLGSGAVKQKPIPNGIPTLAGSMSAEWYDQSAYQLFLSGGIVGVVFDFQGATIASTYKEQIKFDMPAVQVRGESPQVGGPDVLDQTIPFTVGDNGTNPPLSISYMSTDLAV